MPKIVKGGPFGLFQHPFSCKKNEGGPLETLVNFGKSHSAEKIERGTIWGHLKFFEKARTERNRKGDPLGTSGFVGFLEKVNKTRTSKVGAISKAQKAQNNFLEKNLKFFLSKKVA